MRELPKTLLDRHPRIPLGINSAGGSRFSHLFGGVSAECCRTREAEKSDDGYDTGNAQRSPKMEVRAIKVRQLQASRSDRVLLPRSVFAENYVRHIHFRWGHLSR